MPSQKENIRRTIPQARHSPALGIVAKQVRTLGKREFSENIPYMTLRYSVE
jgi:hypothetical protein